ncbi:MAG: hypothetical protein QS721_12740 [Candidatus Endonucleobacter sp. (ex Gigantidas childressi)]|nr:hypothetical protein [Candidatus Endonucleobacter sp. (ex Gigantidas childressi)]
MMALTHPDHLLFVGYGTHTSNCHGYIPIFIGGERLLVALIALNHLMLVGS